MHNINIALSQEDNDSDRGHEDDVLVFCTTSDAEQRKCQAWADAIATELLRSAQLGHSASFEFALRCTRQADRDQCMNSLANQAADLLTLDAGEVFIAGRHHSLVPIASEVYASNQNPLEQNGYYAVAVVHKHGSIQSLHQLAGARACFPAVGQMAGWVLPLVTLLQRRILPVADCNNMIKSAARYFNASCAPGSLIDKHNPTGDNPLSICSLCAANCAGNEPFAGFLGAFRCLLQRGDVAFLKHNTVPMSLERFGRGGQLLGNSITGTNSAGRFAGTGSGSGLSPFDFSLLCPDGSRAELHSYATCNWGFVPAHAIVTVSSVLPEKREKMQRFLMTSASLYGTLIPNSAEFLSPNTGNSFGTNLYNFFCSTLLYLSYENKFRLIQLQHRLFLLDHWMADTSVCIHRHIQANPMDIFRLIARFICSEIHLLFAMQPKSRAICCSQPTRSACSQSVRADKLLKDI